MQIRLAALLLISTVSSGIAVPEVLFKLDSQPGVNGFWAGSTAVIFGFPPSAAISNMNVRYFSASFPPPALGTNRVDSYSGIAEFYFSGDGGFTFNPASAPAAIQVKISHTSDAGGIEFYSTELLQLDAGGGTLPGGVLIRESPTLTSSGLLTIRPVDGQYLQSSFFDAFLEVSLDGGGTWIPANSSANLVLRYDPASITPTLQPSELIPEPTAGYTGASSELVRVSSVKVVLQDFHLRYFSHYLQPPHNGETFVGSCQSRAFFMLSTNDGASFAPADCSVPLNYRVFNRITNSTQATFDTEMLSMDLSGGTLPSNVRLRESPTLPSQGGRMTTVTGADFHVQSFFDVWFEASLDGGATWYPAALPGRLVTEGLTTTSRHGSDHFPPFSGDFVSRRDVPVIFPASALMKDLVLGRFATNYPPPSSSTLENIGAVAYMNLSTNGGIDFAPLNAAALCALIVGPSTNANATSFFDTEMVAMDLNGGSLPIGTLVRESPTRLSPGRISERSAAGAYEFSSFFDVFLEFSSDGGATWHPADAPLFIELRPHPALTISRQGGQNLVKWPAPATGFIPESTPAMSNSATWTPVTNAVLPYGGDDGFARPPAAPMEFYRLLRGP